MLLGGLESVPVRGDQRVSWGRQWQGLLSEGQMGGPQQHVYKGWRGFLDCNQWHMLLEKSNGSQPSLTAVPLTILHPRNPESS